jgi:hypothetical protein
MRGNKMPAWTYKRGHKIEFDIAKFIWVYSDNKESVEKERPCIRCGKMPTKEGHDACLGFLPEVKSACCGHGIEEGFIMR